MAKLKPDEFEARAFSCFYIVLVVLVLISIHGFFHEAILGLFAGGWELPSGMVLVLRVFIAITAVVAGLTWGVICIKYSISCLIGDCLAFAFFLIAMSEVYLEFGPFGSLGQNLEIFRQELYYDWPHYLIFLSAAVVLVVALLHKKKGGTKEESSLKRKALRVVLLAGSVLLVLACCFTVRYVSNHEFTRVDERAKSQVTAATQKTWVAQKNYSAAEIAEAKKHAKPVFSVTQNSYKVATEQLQRQSQNRSELKDANITVSEIIPGSTWPAYLNDSNKTYRDKYIKDAAEPNVYALVSYEIRQGAKRTYEEALAIDTNSYIDGKVDITCLTYDSLLHKYSHYFAGRDSALVLLYDAFGHQDFDYVVTMPGTSVVAESEGEYKAVFIGDPARPVMFASDYVAQHKDHRKPGVVFSARDLSKLLSE